MVSIWSYRSVLINISSHFVDIFPFFALNIEIKWVPGCTWRRSSNWRRLLTEADVRICGTDCNAWQFCGWTWRLCTYSDHIKSSLIVRQWGITMGWVLTAGRVLTLHRQTDIKGWPLTSIQLLLGKESDLFSVMSAISMFCSQGCSLVKVSTRSSWGVVVEVSARSWESVETDDESIQFGSEAGTLYDSSLSVLDRWKLCTCRRHCWWCGSTFRDLHVIYNYMNQCV